MDFGLRIGLIFLTFGGYCSDFFHSPPVQASFDQPKRLLLLDGDDGTVACRVYGDLMSGTIPRFSDNGTLESATRSLLRMRNLTAVRGLPGASMVGPVDYLGNLEEPHRYLYIIQNGFPPLFYRREMGEEEAPRLKELDHALVTTVQAHWVSGSEEGLIEEKQREYNVTSKDLRRSLFLRPGLLEIDRDFVEIQPFDPRGVDLSSFQARLVDHSIPFRITKRPLPSKDDYRLVTYLYEPLYADWQIREGSGLFLEKHQFSQSITPLTPACKGFVALARTNESPDQLELIGIQIPYGYTLLIEEGCIHGDTTLDGFFMMGMTSDHTTMRTADTVFLKSSETKKNVAMRRLDETPISLEVPFFLPPPYVIYKGATERDRAIFRHLTEGSNFIFNPFSVEYWR